MTATSATPSVAASSSTEPGQEADAKSRHRRAAVVLADVGEPGPAAAPRLNARSVGSPRTTSRKCVESRRSGEPALAGALLGVAPDEPHEDRHERQREQHQARPRAVDHSGQREHGEGDDHRQHDLRQVAGEVRLEPVDALHRRRRDLARAGSVERQRLRPAAGARRARGGAPRGRSTQRGGPRPRSPRPARRGPRRRARAAPRSEVTSARPLRRTPPPRSARSASPGAGRARRDAIPRAVSTTSRRRTGRARRTSRGSRVRTVSPRRPARRAMRRLPGTSTSSPDPRAEDVVRPTLVEQDDRQHDQRHDGHHGQRVVLRTRPPERRGCSRSPCSRP